MSGGLRLAVVLASAGRPELLAEIAENCRAQKDVEFRLVISVPDDASLPDDPRVLSDALVLTGTRGLAAQRNVALDALDALDALGEGERADVVAFFDDDAVLRPDYLAEALQFFESHPGIIALTGRVLLDGKITGEITRELTASTLEASFDQPQTGGWRPTRELYGANFVIRTDRSQGLRFDARLPLYSWLEDHDFARRLMPLGTLAQVDNCVMVHRAAASGGRKSHLRLGYSQVMNAVYLQRKGSFPVWLATQQIFRVVAKNIALSPAGPSRSWRRLRLKGNALAAADAVRGRITPERIVDLA